MEKAKDSKKPALGNVMVTGGCGFLGHHIVDLLVSSYDCKTTVVDLRTNRNRRPDSDAVDYFDVDILKQDSLDEVFSTVKPDVVIHTVSPLAQGESRAAKDVFYKVNVEGTKNIIAACEKHDVKALVYTSSSSIVSDNVTDLINVDERWPVITGKLQTEYYSHTKVDAPDSAFTYHTDFSGPRGSPRSCRQPQLLPPHLLHPTQRHFRRR